MCLEQEAALLRGNIKKGHEKQKKVKNNGKNRKSND